MEQKRNGTDKGRMVLSGNKQRGFVSKEEASSPTACTEAIMLTAVMDAKEERDVAT